jgi:hypothetical protein
LAGAERHILTKMSSKLVPFSRPESPIRSAIFKGPPDAVPATEELEALHEELKQLKLKTLERAKKAGEDLKTIEESMRRMKEREKGKAKLVEKIKRERGGEYFILFYWVATRSGFLIMCFTRAPISFLSSFLPSPHIPLPVLSPLFPGRCWISSSYTSPRCGGSQAGHQAPPVVASDILYAPFLRKIVPRSPQVRPETLIGLT